MKTFTERLKERQLPGQLESLGAVIAGNATDAQERASGIHRRFKAMPASDPASTFTMSSGIDQLSSQERASLPF